MDPSYLRELERLRRPIVVMFTDIHSSTTYFEQHGDAAGLLMVHQCNDALRQVAVKHGGRVLKTIGDGMMVAFDKCQSAVAAAIEMQTNWAKVNSLRPESDRVAIRIGVHYGDGIVRSNDIFGDVVNVASRVESVTAPEQIVISDAVYEEVRLRESEIHSLGRFLLKGTAHERTLYEVVWKRAGPTTPTLQPSRSGFKLQTVGSDGSLGPEYPILDSVTLGRYEGDIRFPADPSLAPLNARVFVEAGQLFVEDLSGGAESVFVMLTGGCTLQNEDIVLIGQQVLQFHELSGAMSAVTQVGATLRDITNALDVAVAEMIRLDENGEAAESYPIRSTEVRFGRTRGTYTFPQDKLMSRWHARVLQRGEDFVLEDLGSRNGTFVRVRGKTPLLVGASLLAGSELLRVASNEPRRI